MQFESITNTLGYIQDIWMLNAILESTFLTSVIVGIAIASLFSVAYPRYLEWLRRPKIVFLFRRNRTDEITVKKETSYLSLAILNKNKHSNIDKYYWCLIAKKPLRLRVWEGDSKNKKDAATETLREADGSWTRCFGMIDAPLFHDRSYVTTWTVEINPTSVGPWIIHYYFSTEHGVSPSSAKEMKKGGRYAIKGGHLGKLKIEVVD